MELIENLQRQNELLREEVALQKKIIEILESAMDATIEKIKKIRRDLELKNAEGAG